MSQNKNSVVLSTSFLGAQSETYDVQVLGEVDTVPYLANAGNTLFTQKLNAFPTTYQIDLPRAGKWNLVVLVKGANAKVFNSFALAVEVSSNDDPTTNPNIDPSGNEIFAPYTTGNYEGRTYIFDKKKWVYKSKDNAWQRDYTYTENTVQRMSRVQDLTANAPSLVAIDVDKQLQAINDELAEKASKSDLWEKVSRSINSLHSIEELDSAIGTGFYQMNGNFGEDAEDYPPFNWIGDNGSPVSILVMELMDIDLSYQIAFFYDGTKEIMKYRSMSSG